MAGRSWGRMGTCAAACVLAIGSALPVAAATPAAPDPSFGVGGSVTTDFGGVDEPRDIAVMPDGRIVVVVRTGGRLALARYLPSGALDPTFSGDGRVVTSVVLSHPTFGDVAIQPDGKIVVATGGPLLRFTSAGALDGTFSGDGMVPDDLGWGDVVLRRDGTIVSLGHNLRIYSAAGGILAEIPDVNAGGTGFHLLANQSSGHVVVAGSTDCNHALIDRFTPDLTGARGNVGDIVGVESVGLLLLQDDKVLVVSQGLGNPGCDVLPGIAFERYLPDGTRDAAFGSNGAVVVDTTTWPVGAANGAAISAVPVSGNKVLVLGRTFLARFTTNGVLDRSFSGDGILPLSGAAWQEVAAQPDGHALIAGGAGGNVAVRRYLGTGTVTGYPSAYRVEPGGGATVAGNALSLAARDGNLLQVRSAATGKARAASWSGTFSGVPNGLSSLTVSYTGKASASTSQTLAIWNFTRSTWTTLDIRTVGTSLVTVPDRRVTGALSEYVSGTTGTGSVRIRVTNSAGTTVTSSGERLSITYR